MSYPTLFKKLIDEFANLPGIGPKTAERLAYHILITEKEKAEELASAIMNVKLKTKFCPNCFNFSEGEVCKICSDKSRDKSKICVVEQPKDVINFEKAGAFNGTYHVLLGRIELSEGIGPENLTVKKLIERVQNQDIKEVIIATNPNMEGDVTATYLSKELNPLGVKVTRIGRGLPTGSTIEYANKVMILDSLESRREM